ncbi:MAG: penicillin-binding transpeptidase domain-containing protein, partial [Bacteroidales bacterium]
LYVNHARIPLNERVEPFDGRNLVTTLNLEIQNIVHNELQKKLIEQNADWGCAVVMETKTGEIKAISNLRRADKDGLVYSESMEYALHAMVEPGSTFKLASVLAYLEKIEDDTSKQYPILAHTFVRKNKAGTKEYRFPKVDEPGRIESLGTPIEVFQRSSNVGITSMIFDAYSIDQYSAYLSKIDSMFITTSFSTQLGKVQAPNIKRKATDFHTYYNTCFGAGFTMTPMQTLVYFNAVANNGKMLAPLFVKYITDSHDTVAKFSAEVINPQICKKTTIDRAKKYLEAVVQGEYGSARRYKDSHFSFAGKTGTRDIWDEDIKAYNRAKNSVSFCGYFPAENPIYTCIVFMYNVPKKSSIAVEVFAKIGKNIMNIANYSALQEVNRSKPKVLPRINMVNSEQFSLIMNVMGFENQVKTIPGPYVSTGLNQDYSVYYKSAKFNAKEKLPDVSNMIASDAIHELSKAGYKVKIEGRGVVKSKTVDRKNKIIILYLEPPG